MRFVCKLYVVRGWGVSTTRAELRGLSGESSGFLDALHQRRVATESGSAAFSLRGLLGCGEHAGCVVRHICPATPTPVSRVYFRHDGLPLSEMLFVAIKFTIHLTTKICQEVGVYNSDFVL